MKNRMIHTFAVVALLFCTYGCGNDDVGGSGQSGGAIDTGLLVTIDSLAAKDTPNVDIVMNPDCNGDGTFDDPETFTDHDSVVAFTVTPSPGFDPSVIGKFVTITGYKVSYSLSKGYTYVIVTPKIPDKEYTMSLRILSEASASVDVRLIDLDTKFKILTEYLSNGWDSDLPSYTATYKFYGTDDRARAFNATGVMTFTIGNYNNC